MVKHIFFIFIILIISFLGIQSKNFRIDASSDTLVAKNDKDFEYFNYYNKIFSTNNFLILAIKSQNEINKNFVDTINKLSSEIENLKEIENVFNINKAPILFLNDVKISDLSNDKIETINNSNYNLKEIINELASNPLFNNQIISSNKKISSLIITIANNEKFLKIKDNYNNSNNNKIKNEYIKAKKIFDNERNELIKKIRIIINKSDKNYEYFLGGVDMIANDVISFVKNDIIVFSIAILLIVILVLFFIFRDLKWIFLCLFTSLYSVLSMFGLISLLNIEVTAISSNFVSLMFILSISMNIHIINYYRQNFQLDKNNITITLKKMFLPCLYTVLTTMVAFASLLLSDIKPIIDFGTIMILSLLIIIMCSFTILPLLMSYFPNPKINKSIKFTILNFFYYITLNHGKKIIFINILFLSISIIGIFKLNVENSFINYFKKHTEIYKGMRLIDRELGGTTPLDVIITFKDNETFESNIANTDDDDLLIEDDIISNDLFDDTNDDSSWFTKEKIVTIKEIHEYLDNKVEIGKVQSIESLIRTANKLNKDELSVFELSILYNEIPENYKKDLIYPYLSIDNNMAKISARVKDSYEINRNKLINDINYHLETNYNNISYKVNGLLVLYNNMLQLLFSSQIKSLGFVVLTIFFMLLILFKSLKLSIYGIIPNIIASSSILGLIGLFQIPLDIMTITIAAITIGIAVDNTIHYLYRYNENYKKNMNITKSVQMTNNNVGYAILTTSVTIAFGFSVLILSNFIPTLLFGIFTATAMLLAMLGVLITLPSLLNLFNK